MSPEFNPEIKDDLMRQLSLDDKKKINHGFTKGSGTFADQKTGNAHQEVRNAIRREIGRDVRDQTTEFLK